MTRQSYLHPLDYVTGLRYYLTDRKVDVVYEVSPETFYVYEKIDWFNLGFNEDKGEYAVVEVDKKGVDTLSAARTFSNKLGVPHENVIILGFKDKYSTSKQFFFIKKTLLRDLKVEELSDRNVGFRLIGYVNKKPRLKHLLGNKFKVHVEATDRAFMDIVEIVRLINEKGLPSYYGYQRFGFHRPCSHIVGKYLLLKRWDLFSKTLLKEIFYTEGYETIHKRLRGLYESFFYEQLFVRTRDLRRAVESIINYTKGIYLDSYTSYLYNMLINSIIEKGGWTTLDKQYPTIGCIDFFETYYSKIAETEGLTKSTVSGLKCWFRKGLFHPDVEVKKEGGFVTLVFDLPRGFYASIVLRELFKDGLTIPILRT